MVTIALHELAHGLGFVPLTNPDNSRLDGLGDVYSQYVLDTSTGRTWNQMTDQQRVASASNTSHVVWNGINVRRAAPKVLLTGAVWLRVLEPASISGDRIAGTAEFGPALAPPGVSGELVLAANPANGDGLSPTDACSPLLNLAEAAGRIVMADRGGCDFAQKAENAQAAGAIGLVVTNNVEGSLPRELGGTDPAVTIPAVHITLADGKALKAALARSETVKVMLAADANVMRGADWAGRPMLHASDPSEGLSPISHWDPRATPNQLMESYIRPDVVQEVEPPYDLTLSLLRDLGWFSDLDGVPDAVDECPGSDPGATLKIQGCDTGVRNTTFSTGCRMSDYYKNCAGQSGADFTACVDSVTKRYLDTRVIEAADSNKIHACAVSSAK
jgi:hypothetical protein